MMISLRRFREKIGDDYVILEEDSRQASVKVEHKRCVAKNGPRLNMGSSCCRMWSYGPGFLGWNECYDSQDDTFMAIYRFRIFDVFNAFVWVANKYITWQDFQNN